MADHHHQQHQSNLLGPPELRRKTDSGEVDHQNPNTGDLFMDSMIRNFKRHDLTRRLTKGFAVGGPPMHRSSANPCLDFFFHVIPGTSPKTLNEKLRLSWAHKPLTTLKLVCNLRAIRDKEGFLTAALWLHRKHPRTLASNVASFAEFGCLRDLPEILYRLMEGNKKSEERSKRKGKKLDKSRRPVATVTREARISESEERSNIQKERAKKRTQMAMKLTHLYANNFDFRFLYNKVSQHLADCLKNDIKFLNSGEFGKISPAAKWCPSIDSSYDRSLLLCESIARNIFPRELYEEGLEEAHYTYRVRDRLRKEVLVPLRKALTLPEIPCERVPSMSMRSYNEFLRYDGAAVMEFAISGEEYQRLVLVD